MVPAGWTVALATVQLDSRQILQPLMVVLTARLGDSTTLKALKSGREKQFKAGQGQSFFSHLYNIAVSLCRVPNHAGTSY